METFGRGQRLGAEFLGTALLLGHQVFLNELWEGDVRTLPMVESQSTSAEERSEAARRLELAAGAERAESAKAQQLIDAFLRDVAAAGIAPQPLRATLYTGQSVKTDKRGIGDLNVAVTFGGVTFRPGEYLYADNNGIIVAPQALSMPE